MYSKTGKSTCDRINRLVNIIECWLKRLKASCYLPDHVAEENHKKCYKCSSRM